MIKEILEKINSVGNENAKFYVITRKLKESKQKSKIITDKYDFKIYGVDLSDDVRKQLYDLTNKQLEKADEEKLEIVDYQVIDSDDRKIYTYQFKNSTLAFKNLIDNQLNKGTDTVFIKHISELLKSNYDSNVEDNSTKTKKRVRKNIEEEIWAYCISIKVSDSLIYFFRKSFKANIFVEDKENPENLKIMNSIRTLFNPNTSKLEMIHGESLILDKNIDCLFYDSKFYIFNKYQFEKIVGLDDEYQIEANNVAKQLEETKMISGIEHLFNALKTKSSLYRKLVRLLKHPELLNITAERIKAMETVAEEFKIEFKVKDGKLSIESEGDIDLLIKMIEDYYLKSSQTNTQYGASVKKKLN